MKYKQLILKPRLKQYIEFNITTENFMYDDQIQLCSKIDNSFFFHRYYGNERDTSWFSGTYQTRNRRFGYNEAKNIGLGINYVDSIVSWYLNGILQYSDTLSGWSENAKANSDFDQYVIIHICTTADSYPTLNINESEMKYSIPDGYVSVMRGSFDIKKIYDDTKCEYAIY